MVDNSKQILGDKPLVYGVTLSEKSDRLDCAWFNPIVKNRIEALKKVKEVIEHWLN